MTLFVPSVEAHVQKQSPTHPKHLIAIIIPLPPESYYLEKQLVNAKNLTLHGIHYQLGTIQGKQVVVVLCGIGMINAAMVATQLIVNFHPDLVLMSGSSGGVNPTLHPGDVVIGKNVINVDFGNFNEKGPEMMSHHLQHPHNNEILPLVFTANNNLLYAAKKFTTSTFPKIMLGTIATTDHRPSSPERVEMLKKAGIDVLEMEGVSLMQVCWFYNTSCLVIRGVSDMARIPGHVGKTNGKSNMEMAGNNAAKVLLDILANESTPI